MLESLLGEANLEILRNFVIDCPGQPSLEDETARITSSQDRTSLTEAALTSGLYLSNLDGFAWNDDQSSKFAHAVEDRLLTCESRPDQESSALVSELGIACLHLLSSASSCHLADSTLVKLVAFTDVRDPWTTTKAAQVASSLLKSQLDATILREFIVGPVLQDFLRPLFAKSSSSRVTDSGRPAHYQAATDPSQQFRKTTSWNDQAPSAISVLQWAVGMSEPSLFQEHWPLFTPALLTIAEDGSVEIKARGLEILSIFVEKCPPQIIHTTGIDRIIEDITFPALLYLPSLTPEEDSVKILVPAYSVLIQLAKANEPAANTNRRRLLDKILREGIFAVYSHTSQHTHLVEILMENMASGVKCLGIYSVKHLKDILSTISSVLEDPFAAAYPPSVLQATNALKITIANCWPRIRERAHFEQIVRALSLCWVNLLDDGDVINTDEDDKSPIFQGLLEISKILTALWAQTYTQPPDKLGEIFEKEPRLSQLFPAWSS